MFKVAQGFWRSKTTWAVVGAIVTAMGGAAQGEVTWQAAVGAAFFALIGLFHNDTQRKIGEKEAEDRALLMSMATNGGPRFDLEGVLRAHSSTLKDAVASSVTAALVEAFTPSEPRKPVQLANSGIDARARAIDEEVTGATGTNEDEDGEADFDE